MRTRAWLGEAALGFGVLRRAGSSRRWGCRGRCDAAIDHAHASGRQALLDLVALTEDETDKVIPALRATRLERESVSAVALCGIWAVAASGSTLPLGPGRLFTVGAPASVGRSRGWAG